MLTNVYIDGFNLYYGCLKNTPHKWLDLGALCKRLLPKHDINQIRYFTARITPRAGQRGHREQLIYLRALDTIPNLSIHYGEFSETKTRMMRANRLPHESRTVEVIKTEEKGSDVNLGAYLVYDACKGGIEAAVVITNDSDLCEPVRLARDEYGLKTGVVNPHATRKRSRSLDAVFFKQIRPSILGQCQLPSELTDADGRTIKRPVHW